MDALAPTPPLPTASPLPATRRTDDEAPAPGAAPTGSSASGSSGPAAAEPLPALPASVQRSQLDPEPPPPPLMTREQMAALLLSLTT